MKRKTIITFFISLFALGCLAQNSEAESTPEQRAKLQTDWMKENLSLTEVQTTTIDSLNLVYAKKIEAFKTVKGRFNQIKEARKTMDQKEEELQKIFTKEQFEAYENNKSYLREKMREKSENNR